MMLQLHTIEQQNPRTLFWEWDQAWLMYIACVACMLPLLELLPAQPLKLDTQRIASNSDNLLLRAMPTPVAALWTYLAPGGLSNTGAAFLAFYVVWTLAYLVATVKLRTDSQEGKTFDDIGYLADLSFAGRVWYNIASICG
jgi:hypothetical protein